MSEDPIVVPRHAAQRSGRGVLEGAFLLLDALERLPGRAVGLTALASASGLPKTTTHRLLEQLTELSVVQRLGSGYQLGARLFRLGQAWRPFPGLAAAARRPLAGLASFARGDVGLSVPHGGSALMVAAVAGDHEPVIPARPGTMFPVCTAAGQVLTSERERPAVPDGVPVRGWAVTLERVRAAGVAFDRQEVVPDVACVAVPVRAPGGRLVAAVSLAVRPDRALEALVEPVRHAGRLISRALGRMHP